MNNSQYYEDLNEDASKRVTIDVSSDESTSLECRTIRIGSHKFTPTEKVTFTPKGICIEAPVINDSLAKEVLHIEHREIVKILIHFGDISPVIFIYTLPSCARYVRKKLCMTNPGSGIYFDSCASEEIYKRIALLPSGFTEKFKEKISKYYGKPQTILDELSAREADEILTKISQRESELNSEIRQILIYPPGKGGIPINTEDYGSLEQDKYLNDVIIDFYLKYLCNEILSEEMRNKIHVFSTFFYTRLSSKVDNMSRYDNSDMDYFCAQQHYNRVKNWTKNVNIFEKDFIIIPINENQHWYLAIVCFPGLTHRQLTSEKNTNNINKREGDHLRSSGFTSDVEYAFPTGGFRNLYDNENDSNNSESNQNYLDLGTNKSGSIKQPCILIFDSLSGGAIISRQRTISVIRDYLSCEHQSKFGTTDFDKYSIKGHCVKVPQQDNLTDCGLFVLQYVEHFFKVPITDFSIPIRGLENWFETIVVTRKREDISKLIKKLVATYNADNLPLPDIIFPTLNGKLVEQETLETADEFKDHFADIELDDEFADDDYNESEYDDENEQNFEEDMYETHHKNMKRRATDSESECESRIRRRYKENIEDETVYNGRA
ncbi:sentrin-specific protease 6-like [Ctenocephalides felis]|uniref:sentrin-specific protease 6-like n=1 Tax=Ctenocephalides felis TaxID=7515 RepID=UPI000E6E3B5B|nr:sentrin-specific protease 6-like [Ctenocephalides felis]